MPELPEVSIIVDGLNKKLKGLVLESIEYDWPKGFHWSGFSTRDLKGAKVTGVERRGKVVLIKVSKVTKVTNVTKVFAILIHLKLTGQLIYQDKQSLRSSSLDKLGTAGLKKTRVAGGHPIPPLNLLVPNKTTRVTFGFTNPSTSSGQVAGYLYFNDIRKFGWVKIVTSDKEQVTRAIGTELGPDALEISFEAFKLRLVKKPNSRIKKLLMDQAFISGIGNIYSDEALWQAKIHPARLVSSLESLEIRKLYDGIRDSLKLAIEKGGSSASAYVDSGGEKGLYLSYAKAYHMTGRPCARCKTPIVRKKMDGRSAHFCPSCQRLQ